METQTLLYILIGINLFILAIILFGFRYMMDHFFNDKENTGYIPNQSSLNNIPYDEYDILDFKYRSELPYRDFDKNTIEWMICEEFIKKLKKSGHYKVEYFDDDMGKPSVYAELLICKKK